MTPDQQTAFAVLGANPYDGLGGSDRVTLPSEANYNKVYDGKPLGWKDTLNSLFHTSSRSGDNYTVIGSDGSYYVNAGAGNDFITITGDGASTIIAGSGNDLIRITGNGNNGITVGTGIPNIQLDGSGNNILQILGGSAPAIQGSVLTRQDPSGQSGSVTFKFQAAVKENFEGNLSGDGGLYVEGGSLAITQPNTGFTGSSGSPPQPWN